MVLQPPRVVRSLDTYHTYFAYLEQRVHAKGWMGHVHVPIPTQGTFPTFWAWAWGDEPTNLHLGRYFSPLWSSGSIDRYFTYFAYLEQRADTKGWMGIGDGDEESCLGKGAEGGEFLAKVV